MLQFQKTSGQELWAETRSDEGSEYSADPERTRAESRSAPERWKREDVK